MDAVVRGTQAARRAGGRPLGAKPRGDGGGAGRRSAWLAVDGSKRWGEAFFLLYTPFWLTLCLGVIVPFKLYEEGTSSFIEPKWLAYGEVINGRLAFLCSCTLFA
ncbi:hypothetical protein C2845_PM09G18150 [Panicum miliaceum]|uniref:Uncharacterized protein n=1 Tax=Panicum miliaceum TaxID=4540 RepID=A0A3L6RXH3_PANMI|nr:hypothetical protein C2845_PM09G18150 [Panicum miliaceum]